MLFHLIGMHGTTRENWVQHQNLLSFISSLKQILLMSLTTKHDLQRIKVYIYFLYFQVQNLEKAGILNKTKVSENGRKVR